MIRRLANLVYIRVIAIALSVLLLSACGLSNGRMEQSESGPHLLAQEVDEIAIGETPSLAGGTEQDVRDNRPANNRALARMYPNLIALNAPWTTRRIAITFDDGPDRQYTPKVLDILKKHHVKATFFLMGSRVKGHPDVTRRIHQEGHVIGNHTFWHPKLYAESVERLVWEVEQTDDWIKKTVGYTPTLFRAPYGGLDTVYVEKLGELGKTIIGWSVDTQDWRQISSAEVQRNLFKDIHPGAIILMHSAGDWTQDLSGMTEALDELIPRLKKEGYEIVTVPELLGTSFK